ncbi:hypothetical protein [Arthrobacter bambusae]|uniref:hypothetical protein n=1 Tax=Arthrobacter bambusae TaxID=1338426 RepID=UPI002783D729|nr:hypothetical protein [Arthrobacter bambusae]MDQ0028730.1 hypothetical protein [Arthrobacter bambusae]MDQ0096477.1 hypothetical protein [Arthrobacter bambusae]
MIEALAVAEELVVALGAADAVAVPLRAEELLGGAGAGGPKQPESAKRAQTPKTLNAGGMDLDIRPP